MIREKLIKLDQKIMVLINVKLRCRPLDLLMPIITYLGSSEFSAVLALSSLIVTGYGRDSYGLKLTLTLILSGILTQVIKRTVNRLRPFLIMKELHIKKIGIDDFSFPSGHTTAAFSMAVMSLLFYPHLTIPSLILALLTGISRVYLGVHFPTDVAMGAIIGSSASLLIYYFL
ncbi:phosphatase PAP2 family protein [Alloiococcus sp. CFN-8]|uniref:phosphatase PAP2 family protein n=1 Tax=Alloiococcus sp. CFN-8 TaxID=3416081 RepID=UPI003CFA4B1F